MRRKKRWRKTKSQLAGIIEENGKFSSVTVTLLNNWLWSLGVTSSH